MHLFFAHLPLPLTDRQWAYATRWRLGLDVIPLGSPTGENTRESGAVACGALLERSGDHAVACDTGPRRNFRHNTVADAYADMFEALNAPIIRREAYAAEMSNPSGEAWMDLWVSGLPEFQDLLADVTVRHPFAIRYQPHAAAVDGSAAAVGAVVKRRRYPSKAGRQVTPLGHETWGRLGDDAEDLLARCQAVATRLAHRAGRSPPAFLKHWRPVLDATLAREVASQLHFAAAGTPGRPRERRPPPRSSEAACPLP